MRKNTLGDRLRYTSDKIFSKGTIVLIGWLAVVTAVVIFGIAFVVWISGVAPGYDFLHLAWMGLMRTLDSGTMGGDEGSWPFLLAMLTVTFAGIFVLSTLIGILTTGIDARLEGLRKGRSRVVEDGHTIIFGWSQQVFTILSELAIANANQSRSCVVILAPHDKVEMEEAIRSKAGDLGRTRVVCRTGDPIEVNDLEIASPATARSIIILAPEQENPDAEVIKVLLAITHSPDRREQPYHIVAELRDPKNQHVAKMVGRDEVEIVLAGDLIARLLAQTSRQSGLSVVYSELLSFAGAEFYFQEEPNLVGKTFGEALLAYETSSLVGIENANGVVQINPPAATRIEAGDRMIAISDDDDMVVLSARTDFALSEHAIRTAPATPHQPEKALILGWNWRATAIINELDHYVVRGSQITVVADFAGGEQEIAERCSGLENQAVTYLYGDTTDRRLLDSLDISSYNHVITLSYSDTLGVQQADARTLITLLHLRDIASQHSQRFSVVSEMLDLRNRNLAEVARADDYIVSDRLISLMLAQISENKGLNSLFEDLFNASGSEIYLRPVEDYVEPGEEINFYTVVEAALRRGQVAIGYRRNELSGDSAKNYGVVVNPNKGAVLSFQPGDSIIVLAEE